MCTSFKHPKAMDGTSCVGRTMEFPDVLPWQIGVLASDHEGRSASSANAKTWKAEHGIVGMSGFDTPQWLGDAMNTAGLSGHTLYMPGHCTYQPAKHDGSDIGALETIAFVLGTCSTTAEARAALATCNVVDFQPPQISVPLPLHIVFHDESSCIVAEFHPEGMRVLDNPVQVVTNSPYLEWHLENLDNYVNFSDENPGPMELGGTTFAPGGQGQGLRGLPGDETGVSRFVRLATIVRFAQQPTDEQAAVLDTIRVLHGFDLVPGTVMETAPDGTRLPLVTLWSTVCNLTGNTYSYNATRSPLWYEVDLATTDFSTTRSVPLVTDGWLTPTTV